MQLTSTECFMTTVLNCGYADLIMLDNIYSELADCCCDIDSIIDDLQENDCLNLNSLLTEVYNIIKDKICDKAKELIEDEYLFNCFNSVSNKFLFLVKLV